MGQRILLYPVVRSFVHTLDIRFFSLDNPGANLTYLCIPRTIFHGSQIIHWNDINAKKNMSSKVNSITL